MPEPYLVCLGKTDEIGASCHYLHIEGTGILLDAGADPEQEGEDSIPELALVRDRPDAWVDHVMISHAHHDHLGSLPVVIRTFPHVLVHMTRATRDLANVLLPSSARLQVKRLREGSSSAAPLFDVDELEAFEYLYLTHHLEIPFDLTGIRGARRVTGRLWDAGHVLGAAGLELEIQGEPTRRIFYTSDTSLRPQAILPGGSYPEGPIDTLILESTLGADPDAETTTRKTEERRFGEAVKETLDRGGTVLVPVFALGRGQEVLAMIDRFKRRGLIDEDTPVYSAGLMRAISDVYDKTRFSTPRLNNDFEVYGVEQKRLPRSQAGLTRAIQEPGILVVGSGMMFERTISNKIAQEMVENEKNAILLVGYAREDSPAHRLMEAEGHEPEVILDEHRGPQTLRCSVGRFRFSGHSHRRDLLDLVERLDPKRVILVHGDEQAREWMADNIRYFNPAIDVVTPAHGEEVALLPE
ncbi:MAG: MBL fold metallo-hydrolase [Rhodothermales bacterium]|nr:MBL fold metallo-hydrolase [Rhodothermales bacterium]MBO6779383.1 MBL fold metallo-hydrolase [Rhodothermales bacterium]